jgi:hypothetical protein
VATTTPYEAYRAAAQEYFGTDSRQAARAVKSWQQSQGANSWDDGAMAHSYFQLEKATNLGTKSAFMNGKWATPGAMEANYKTWVASKGITEEKISDAIAFHHQYVQEMLEHSDFRGNDWERGVIHLVRTVPEEELAGAASPSSLNGVAVKGTNRGPNVSMGVANAKIIYNRHVTAQAVPHARVTGAYWLPPSWEDEGDDPFAGVGENEFGVLAPNIDFQYIGESQQAIDHINNKIPTLGKDASKWGVPLGHLKKLLIAWLQKLQRTCGCS